MFKLALLPTHPSNPFCFQHFISHMIGQGLHPPPYLSSFLLFICFFLQWVQTKHNHKFWSPPPLPIWLSLKYRTQNDGIQQKCKTWRTQWYLNGGPLNPESSMLTIRPLRTIFFFNQIQFLFSNYMLVKFAQHKSWNWFNICLVSFYEWSITQHFDTICKCTKI